MDLDGHFDRADAAIRTHDRRSTDRLHGGTITHVGTATFVANDPVAIDGVVAAVTASRITGDNSATWNPTIDVHIRGGIASGVYTGTITHSADAAPAPDSIGIRLAEVPVGVADDLRARLYIIDHVAPGSILTRKIEISNTSGSAASVAVYTAAATIARGAFVGAAERDGERAVQLDVGATTRSGGPRERDRHERRERRARQDCTAIGDDRGDRRESRCCSLQGRSFCGRGGLGRAHGLVGRAGERRPSERPGACQTAMISMFRSVNASR